MGLCMPALARVSMRWPVGVADVRSTGSGEGDVVDMGGLVGEAGDAVGEACGGGGELNG